MSEETNPQDLNHEDESKLFGAGDSFAFGSAPEAPANADASRKTRRNS
ncbi:hypothetical protein MUN84_22420 [Hymenobacter sp. 5516J-16]|nr:hypothetical protein [Hymenobacter sp. 5516J-16]UOQ77166.1 hypothetical protein MUN84_22420 [Hymenobacter sp. 5516J-16]